MTKNKQIGNPRFSFLFPADLYHGYYRYVSVVPGMAWRKHAAKKRAIEVFIFTWVVRQQRQLARASFEPGAVLPASLSTPSGVPTAASRPSGFKSFFAQVAAPPPSETPLLAGLLPPATMAAFKHESLKPLLLTCSVVTVSVGLSIMRWLPRFDFSHYLILLF